MPRLASLVICAALAAAGCGTYNYNRAALVPHATPALHGGAPMQSVGELSVGASSVAHLGDPEPGDPNAGIEIPGTQLHGDLRLRIPGTQLHVGLLYEHGLASTAEPLKSTQPPVDGGDVRGYGFSGDVSISTSNPAFFVGIAFDLMLWSAPFVEYLTCQAGEECFPYAIQNEGRDHVATGGVSVTPTYRVRELTLWGGLTARQHPTLEQKGVETDPAFLEPEIQSGPINVVVSAGAAYSFGAVTLSAIAYYDVSREPAKYGPGLAALITIPFGRDPVGAPATPPQMYYYVPGQQPAPPPTQ